MKGKKHAKEKGDAESQSVNSFLNTKNARSHRSGCCKRSIKLPGLQMCSECDTSRCFAFLLGEHEKDPTVSETRRQGYLVEKIMFEFMSY